MRCSTTTVAKARAPSSPTPTCLGMPLRLTVSPRTLAKNGVELKLRKEKAFRLVPLETVLEEIRATLA